MLIYLITNNLDQKQYVGQTIHSLDSRWGRHVYTSQHNPKSSLHQAMLRDGIENFTVQILDETAKNRLELHALEARYIQELGTTYPLGYNLTTGGQGHIVLEKTKRLISQANKDICAERGGFRLGMKSSPEHIEKIRIANTGKKHSEETKRKISESKTNPSDETRQKLRDSHLGHKHSEETRRKMREAHRKRLQKI